MKLSTVISNVTGTFRTIKAYTMGKNVETANYVGPGNIDFNPVKNMKAIFAKTKNSSEPVIIGYINKTIITDLEEGEGVFFSTDGKTALATIKARKNGDIEINGNSDNAVRFSELESAYNQLKSDHDSLVSAFNQHVHPTAAVGPPSPPTPVPSVIPASNSTGDISGAKIDNVKVN